MPNPFSKEIPELLTAHLDHLKSSALSLEVIRERGYRSVLGKKELRDNGFSTSQQRTPGILIPLHGVNGQVIGYQHRPDRPRRDPKRDRLIKYENPRGSSVRLDVPPRCRQQLGNPKVPVWFSEGVKKVDALATLDACAVGLTGVWGFKGKNPLGGTTVLADFDYITLKERLVYLVFDSDSSSNPQVALALNRLSEHLKRKGARVRIIKLPAGEGDQKQGVDDYLAAGHTMKDLIGLEAPEEAPQLSLRDKSHEAYCVEAGRICYVKQTQNGPVTVPLCNFVSHVTEDILKDDGHEPTHIFKVAGTLGNGVPLPVAEIPAANFAALNWVINEWGLRAVITAGQTYKDRLREAIQLMSSEAQQKTVYTHTGWREINGMRTFLTAGGAMGMPDVDVELEGSLRRYCLPAAVENPGEAIAASLAFLDLGEPAVVVPIWATMYLAPLSELLCPAFTLWLVGPSGSFKSTLAALALCHFGEFTVRSLPASWRDTANYLEKQMALAKDIPLIIDDWAPAQDMSRAREYEVKAEQVARAQGNRMGRGRLRSDTSSRAKYIPRGVLLSTGEQLPSGQSHTARLFAVELEYNSIDAGRLTEAQKQAHLYPGAMAGYIVWLSQNWADISAELPKTWDLWRSQAMKEKAHPRLPEAVAWLYAGLNLGLSFAEEKGAISADEAEERRKAGWKLLVDLAVNQGGRVEEERPGRLFLEGLIALEDSGKAVFGHKDDEIPRKVAPNEVLVGWKDADGNYLLNPDAVYNAVFDFYARRGRPFAFKPTAVWKDLKRMGLSICQNGRPTHVEWLLGGSRRVISIPRQKIADIREKLGGVI
jgi:hypothetical protein